MSLAIVEQINALLKRVKSETTPLCLLHGEEAYLIQMTAQRVVAELLHGGPREEVLHIRERSDANVAEIISDLRTGSLFGSQTIFWIKDPVFLESMSAGVQDRKIILESLAGGFAGRNALLLTTHRRLDKRDSFLAQVSKSAPVLEFPPLGDKNLGNTASDEAFPFVRNHLKKQGKTIAPRAFFLLRELVENNLYSVINALDVLCAYSGDSEQIQPDDVLTCVPRNRQDVVFKVTNDITEGKRDAALERLGQSFLHGETPERFHALLSNHLRTLAAARLLRRGSLKGLVSTGNFNQFQGSLETILAALAQAPPGLARPMSGKKPYVMFLTFKQAEAIPLRKLTQGLLELAEIDKALKTTQADGRLLIENMVLRLAEAS